MSVPQQRLDKASLACALPKVPVRDWSPLAKNRRIVFAGRGGRSGEPPDCLTDSLAVHLLIHVVLIRQSVNQRRLQHGYTACNTGVEEGSTCTHMRRLCVLQQAARRKLRSAWW